jgi:hypothetical protein
MKKESIGKRISHRSVFLFFAVIILFATTISFNGFQPIASLNGCVSDSAGSDDGDEKTEQAGTRTNPIPLNTSAVYDGLKNTFFYKFKIELTLTQVIRGEAALELAKEGNMFNSAPPEGKEYLFAKFKIVALDSKDDAVIDVNSALFDLVSQSGTAYNDFVSVAGVTPKIEDMNDTDGGKGGHKQNAANERLQ